MQPAGFFRPIVVLPVAHGVEPEWKEEKRQQTGPPTSDQSLPLNLELTDSAKLVQ